MTDQVKRANAFHKMHHGNAPFIIPNPWDVGSARMLEAKGFKALATTSAGFVFASGKPDGSLSRDEVFAHCANLARHVSLPISADLEDGYSETLNGVSETYRLAGQAGVVGGSIEDKKTAADSQIYDLDEAVDRVRAAVEGARSLPFKFTLTARAENFLCGRPDLDDTITRLQAYQEAGADVLFAPGLTRLDDIKAVIDSVDLPLNVIVGLPNTQFTVADLEEIGVTRISLGSSLFRKAFGTAMDAADKMLNAGTFDFAATAKPFAHINKLFDTPPL